MNNKTQFSKSLLLSILTACSIMSAQAAIHSYTVSFGPSVGGSSGTGSGTVNYDDVGHLLTLQASWSGLTGTTTASHIHAPTTTPFVIGGGGVVITPGTLTGFPTGVSSGSYSMTFDLTSSSTYPAAYITANGGTTAGAEAAITMAIAQGRAYWNIHTSFAGGGEISSFMTPVPEPSSLALVGLGVAGIALQLWRRRRESRV